MVEQIGRFLGSIKDIFPLITRHFFVITLFVALLTWAVLLLPQSIFVFLHFDNLRTTYLQVIGILAFVATFSFLFGLMYKCYTTIANNWKNKQISRQRENLLCNLTPTEYKRLYKYLENQSHTATFDLYDGVVAGLVDKGVLYKADAKANKAGEQDFNINPWAYDYLSVHLKSLMINR